jgi:hypothetical protein
LLAEVFFYPHCAIKTKKSSWCSFYDTCLWIKQMDSLRSLRSNRQQKASGSKGFDDFQVRLGDLMRGERATMGKSLMDVQRELKIRAEYIAAVEDCNPTAFDTPGFIAGYVRSYAKYLGMDPEISFERFCNESGFEPIHGMSDKALPNRKTREERLAIAAAERKTDSLGASTTPYTPPHERFYSKIDLRALFSSLVLINLVGILGYGAYTVVRKIQQVEMAPVDQPPYVISDLDPLVSRSEGLERTEWQPGLEEKFARFYQPQALVSPILTPRDGPISSLNPNQQGALIAQGSSVFDEITITPDPLKQTVQLVEAAPNRVQLVSSEGVWLRVRDSAGSVLFEKVMDAKVPFNVPLTEEPAVVSRAGNSGALFFLVNGLLYGPAGKGGNTVKNIELSPEYLVKNFDIYIPNSQASFYSFFRDLEANGLMQ